MQTAPADNISVFTSKYMEIIKMGKFVNTNIKVVNNAIPAITKIIIEANRLSICSFIALLFKNLINNNDPILIIIIIIDNTIPIVDVSVKSKMPIVLLNNSSLHTGKNKPIKIKSPEIIDRNSIIVNIVPRDCFSKLKFFVSFYYLRKIKKCTNRNRRT